MDRQAYESMMRGWYVALILQMERIEQDPDLGPKISIKKFDGSYASFPHPLLHPGKLDEINYLAAVIESSIIAQALCSSAGSLAPLEAYKRLSELGADETALNPELEEMILNGSSPTDEADEVAFQRRTEEVLGWLDSEKEEFDVELGKAMAGNSFYSYPLVWEIRDDVHAALRTLREQIASVQNKKTSRPRPKF